MGKKKKTRRSHRSDADTFFGAERSRGRSERHRRKDAQLCAQVRDAVALVVAEDPVLSGAWVVEATPAPHIGHLQIVVAVQAGTDVDVVHQRLESMTGQIRSEVADSIHRKKTPSLSFVVMRQEPR